MLSTHNSSKKESVVISSADVVYRSNWLEQTQGIKNLLSNIGKNLPPSIGFESDQNADKWIFGVSTTSASELREIQAFFHLFMKDLPHPFELTKEQKRFNNPGKPFEYTGDPNWELDESLRQDVQLTEKAVLACLFLDRDAIPAKFRYIHDLMHRTPIERFNRSYVLPNHWEIPLPDQTREVSSLGLEKGTTTLEDLLTLKTRSYYHIQKDELMERVRYLLCRGLLNNDRPNNMEEIEEMYEKLLDYRGAIMWEIASNQFPNDEVIFIWNRSMTSQSIERAWYLPLTPIEINDSIPNFNVTYHGMIKDGDELIPIVDDDVWTNNQFRDVLGYDWMFDQNLTLEDNWMGIRRNIDDQIVRRIAVFGVEVATLLPTDDNYQGGILIKTNSDHVFLNIDLANLIQSLKNLNLPADPSRNVEYHFHNGFARRNFSLVVGNLLKSIDARYFLNEESNSRNFLPLRVWGLKSSYMLNLFFHQNRLDGLYSWYQDIYLANVRYLREYLRSVDLNEDYQLSGDVSELTLDDEWQTYLRNSNVFVDTFVRSFGNFSYPLVRLNDPRATPNDLNNLKLLRLSLMQDMNYLCFLAQSHFLRSMISEESESEPNLLSYMFEKSVLLNNLESILAEIKDSSWSSHIKRISSFPLVTQRKYTWLDYLTLTRFLQDDPSYEDELSWTRWIDSHFDDEHIVTSQEQLSRWMFKDVDCQVHNQAEYSRMLDRDRQNLLDEWYLSSENRKVNPNLHNRELRSLLPIFFMLQVLNGDHSENFLPTNAQLNDPIRFVSTLELANSFFDDYYSRKTWNDDDVDMVEKVLTKYNPSNDLTHGINNEFLNNEFLNHVRQGNHDGITDLLLLLGLLTQRDNWLTLLDSNKDNLYHRLNDYGVSTLRWKREIKSSLLEVGNNVYNWSQFINESILNKTPDSSPNEGVNLRVIGLNFLKDLRKVEQYIQDVSQYVKRSIEVKAPFLRQSEREEDNNLMNLKLLHIDDSVIRNIFVRNHMLNRLARVESRDDNQNLALPSLRIFKKKGKKDIEQAIQGYISGLDTVDSIGGLMWERAWLNQGLYLESDYLGWLLREGINLEMTESTGDFLRQVKEVNDKVSIKGALDMFDDRLIGTMGKRHRNLTVNRGINVTEEDSQVNLDRIGTLISKREHVRLLLQSNVKHVINQSDSLLGVINYFLGNVREVKYCPYLGIELPVEILELDSEDDYNQPRGDEYYEYNDEVEDDLVVESIASL